MAKLFVRTFGCKVNQYETEAIREKLVRTGYSSTEDFSKSDICVINSCSVTALSDRKCRQFVRKVLRENEKARIVVTGCYATRDPEELEGISPRIEVYSNQQKDSLPQIISGCSLPSSESAVLRLFSGQTRAFLKVQDGCDAACTYCIIPKVRPQLYSRPMKEIVLEAENFLKRGYKEIVLTGIRLGCYGLTSSGEKNVNKNRASKGDENLVALLENLVMIPKDFRIRLSSLEITEVTEELLLLVKSTQKICRHFHLPLQSGDDSILKKMGRWYDSKFFSERINQIRNILPDAGLTTDIIAGFPGETDENFQNSYNFLKKHFNGMHVFPFSPRAGTAALKLKNPCLPSVAQKRVYKLLELDGVLRREFQNRFKGEKRVVIAERDGGYSDNGIRLFPPLPFPKGEMRAMSIP